MDFKVVSVTPAGRKRYLELLSAHLLKNRHLINEHHFWVNTTNKEDIEYINYLVNKYPSFFKAIYPKIPVNGNASIHQFFNYCTDPHTIYIRFDDDICWMSVDAVKELLDCRIRQRWPFLVFANIVNNGICTHLHQRMGAIPLNIGYCGYNAIDPLGFSSGVIAERIHNAFFDNLASNSLEQYKFGYWTLWDAARFSINCFAWFGSDFASFDGLVHPDEEMFMSVVKPSEIQRPNIICGRALVSHFAYHPQRKYLEGDTGLLEKYKSLVQIDVV